jgi:hypothetical protein
MLRAMWRDLRDWKLWLVVAASVLLGFAYWMATDRPQWWPWTKTPTRTVDPEYEACQPPRQEAAALEAALNDVIDGRPVAALNADELATASEINQSWSRS